MKTLAQREDANAAGFDNLEKLAAYAETTKRIDAGIVPLRARARDSSWSERPVWSRSQLHLTVCAVDAIQKTRERMRITNEAVPVFYRAGVNMLAGSDCGASNNFAWPGWSLHEELVAFGKAGLTPLDALRLATRAPARFLEEERDRGTIEKGKIADLVLLDANPLDDIANTQKIAGVMARGKWYDRGALDRMLREVENGAARRSAARISE